MMSSFDWNRFKTCSKSEGKQLLEEIKITYGTDDYAELCNQFRYIKETVIDPLNEILIDKSDSSDRCHLLDILTLAKHRENNNF